MVEDFYIDLEKFTLKKFKNELKQTELLPSRQILKEQIDKRFAILEKNGVSNLQDLSIVLKTPKKTREFAKKSGLPSNYLLILRREVNSYHPKPVNLEKFPGIQGAAITKLNSIGIKNTRHLFERIKNNEDRMKLSTETGIDNEIILELTKLTDLSRIKWMGPVFARIFFESGTDTAEKVSKADAESLYKKLKEINKEIVYTRGNFIQSDVKLCIKVAKMVPKSIEY